MAPLRPPAVKVASGLRPTLWVPPIASLDGGLRFASGHELLRSKGLRALPERKIRMSNHPGTRDEWWLPFIDPRIDNATWHTAFGRLQSRFSEVRSHYQCADQ